MTDKVTARATDDQVSTEKKLEDLYDMIDEIGNCMLTTRRADGYLVSRPMQVQLRTDEGNLWFVTDESTEKLDELETDPHVNCAFFREKAREWISVSGIGRVSRDRAKIRELYKPDWKAWFPEESKAKNGGPDDPRMMLIKVDAHSVVYLKSDRPRPLAAFQIVKAMITGSTPKTGDLRHVREHELGRE